MTISETLWVLIGVQITMGAFDMFYHHEMTERLAWRGSAARELRLHAVRNWFYAFVFAVLGFARPAGLVAMALISVLVIEVLITLWDFVEEDLSRRLPASERVTHTLLALNYGAVLVLLVPELVAAANEPTALQPAWHGIISVLCAIAAGGVLVFGFRDWFASARCRAFDDTVPRGLASGLPARQHILVTGATGFIGVRLSAALVAEGHRVTALVRPDSLRTGRVRAALPTPLSVVSSLAEVPDDARIDAIVNLAGAPVAEWLWTRTNRMRILRSRIKTTRAVAGLIDRLAYKPHVFVSGSAIGFYGYQSDDALTEAAPQGSGFAAGLCAAWEAEARRIETRGVRVVMLRTGVVLGRDGGMLARLLPPFDLCGGGRIGNGQQWLSWIGRDDVVRLITFAIGNGALSGPVNATAPGAVRNHDFARTLGRVLQRPAVLPLPAAVLRLTLGVMGEEILLGGQRVLPAKALAAGFMFRHGDIEALLRSELGTTVCSAREGAPARIGEPAAR